MKTRTNLKPWRRCYWIVRDYAVHPNTVLRIYAVNSVDLIIDRMMQA